MFIVLFILTQISAVILLVLIFRVDYEDCTCEQVFAQASMSLFGLLQFNAFGFLAISCAFSTRWPEETKAIFVL